MKAPRSGLAKRTTTRRSITVSLLLRSLRQKTKKTVEPEAGAQFKVLKNDGTYLKDPDKKEVICEADKEGKVSIPWLLPGVYSLKQTDGSKFHEKLNEENNEDAVLW